MSVLDFAGGGGTQDPASQLPLVTSEHVQAARRLIDISTSIREVFRGALEDLRASDGADASDAEPPHLAVNGHYSQAAFGDSLGTQPLQVRVEHRPGDALDESEVMRAVTTGEVPATVPAVVADIWQAKVQIYHTMKM